MKRRQLLWGSAGALVALGAGTAWFKPGDVGQPHNTYFRQLNDVMKRDGPGYPVMLIDLDRLNQNISVITEGIDEAKTYRVVVKSLPSVQLLEHVMNRARTNALMVFHQPFLNRIAEQLPDSDVLLGKPMPVNAVRTYYRRQKNERFDSERQVQWLVDSIERLQQYAALAGELGVKMRVNLEIDVGLHRGGLSDFSQTRMALDIIEQHSEQLTFAGYMGYEPHLAGVADSIKHPSVREVLDIYEGHISQAKLKSFDPEKLTLNGAGSHTIRLYRKDRLMNDLSAGSAIVKPSDFDTMHLSDATPAAFIATPILKHSRSLVVPGSELIGKALPTWDPNTKQLYFIYGGYWKAKPVSPPGMQDWLYKSTNQAPLMASESVDLTVDDYVFFRPNQSEQLFLEFPELVIVDKGEIVDSWQMFKS